MLETVVHIGKKPVEFLIIWLHGLGADGYDFKPLAEQLDPHLAANVAFVFPHAPEYSVTINGGMKMRAWYDILSMNLEREVNKTHINSSVKQVNELVESEMKKYNLDYSRVILAGFSQGGVIALDEFFRHGEEKGYAGIMALSTYHHELERVNSLNKNTPVLLAHGTQDPVVDISLAENVQEKLQHHEANYQWKTYPMAHNVSPEEVRDILQWINGIVSEK